MPRIIVILFLTGLLASCSNQTVYSEFHATGSSGWSAQEAISFSFQAPDTVTTHDMFIYVRNDDSYPYSNLFLIASINFPGGEVIKDTLEYEMARPDGSWMGEGYGSLRENKLWYKEGIVFPQTGTYQVDVEHALRKNGNVEGEQQVPGITDVGLEIVKRD